MNTLTWLHLSDLHMRRDELDNMRVVLDALWDDIPTQVEKLGGQLDFIAFTGDVAWTGREDDYKLAREYFFEKLLKHTGLSRDKLFIVPGNHDTDRDLIDLVNPEIPPSRTDRDKVAALLRDDAKRRLLFTPMMGYTQFVQRFFGPFPDHPMLHDPPYYYTRQIDLGGHSVALLGLNSAWLSGFFKDARGEVYDHGKLIIGDKQISDALREVKDATMRIALMHHPTSWLNELDSVGVEGWLRQKCDFILHGHLHKPHLVKEDAPSGETVIIPAGTVYKRREWLNGYNLVRLDFDAGRGIMVLRQYSETLHQWIKDIQSTGDELDGLVEFKLPDQLRQPVRPLADSEDHPVTISIEPRSVEAVAEVLNEIKPAWLRLGREREAQRLDAFLEQEAEDILWIRGNEGCGAAEFLQIARALLQHRGDDVVYFDAEDTLLGMAMDQYYFVESLERWAGITSAASPRAAEGIDKRLERLLTDAKKRLVESGHRLVLILANYRLLLPPVREWVLMTLWSQIRESLNEHKPLAIFSYEGSALPNPTGNQQSEIYLTEFTVGDIENFLLTIPVAPREAAELARKIHSESTNKFLASPRRIYCRLAVKLALLNKPGDTDEQSGR